MHKISGKTEHPYTVEVDSELTGMITETTTVKTGVHFKVTGMITADLIVEPSATVLVTGMVNGRIHNSGHLTISGMVDSVIGGNIDLKSGAIIRDRE